MRISEKLNVVYRHPLLGDIQINGKIDGDELILPMGGMSRCRPDSKVDVRFLMEVDLLWIKEHNEETPKAQNKGDRYHVDIDSLELDEVRIFDYDSIQLIYTFDESIGGRRYLIGEKQRMYHRDCRERDFYTLPEKSAYIPW